MLLFAFGLIVRESNNAAVTATQEAADKTALPTQDEIKDLVDDAFTKSYDEADFSEDSCGEEEPTD